MKKKISLVILFFSLIPFVSSAANKCADAGAPGTLGACISQVYIWSIGAAGILALLMIVFGGYVTLTAAGNAERASRGRGYIWSSLIGLFLLLGAYLLLNTINPDLTNFNFDSFDKTFNATQATQPNSSTTNTTPLPGK